MLACVDQPRVYVVRIGQRPHAKDAVFRLEQDFPPLWNKAAYQCRYADPKVDIPAFGNVLCNAGGNLLTVSQNGGLLGHVRGLTHRKLLGRAGYKEFRPPDR